MSRSLHVTDLATMSLAELCTRLADIYTHDASTISGAVFAELAKRLTAAELKPGGPYRDTTNLPTARVNAAVGQLFAVMGERLPNVDAYLEKMDVTVLGHEERIAIQKYRQAIQHTKRRSAEAAKSAAGKAAYTYAAASYKQASEPVRQQALTFLKRVDHADTTGEIAHIAEFASTALDLGIANSQLTVLAEANIHAWIAYMLYDHIIDGETDTDQLPTANIAMRHSLARYKSALPADHPFQSAIDGYFDEVDTASAWELAHARYTATEGKITFQKLPHYGTHAILASRSVIHILGPLLAVEASGQTIDEPRRIALVAGLREYLIARQLSDDMHDWREDLAGGRISAVVTELLRHTRVKPGQHDIAELTKKLQHGFMKRTMKRVCEMIATHSKAASTQLKVAGCNPDSQLVGLTDRLTKLAGASLAEREKLIEFGRGFTLS